METNKPNEDNPVPPAELHGKLVAWDKSHTDIVASGESYQEVKKAALAAGETDPIFEQIPSADEGFVGNL